MVRTLALITISSVARSIMLIFEQLDSLAREVDFNEPLVLNHAIMVSDSAIRR